MLEQSVNLIEPAPEPFKLVFEDHPGYFFACVEAKSVTHKMTIEYDSQIAAAIGDSRADSVMIKRDVPMTKNAGNHCALMYLVPNWQVRQIRYAFVDVNPSHISSYDLALLYARGSGIIVDVFDNVPAAKEWLLR